MGYFERILQGLAGMPGPRKMALAIVTVMITASIMTFVYFTNQEDFRILFTNLTSEDGAAIVTKLKEKKIPYQVSPSGETVSVPSEQVSELRLELAAAGIPHGGGVGFEIFDSKVFGATEFEQQMNYRRALQGELSRTINSLDEIQQSRVHIVLPKESLFVEQQKKPTASVTLKLKKGRKLKESQIDGIAHLVASSVEGLSADEVMIVDSQGNIISKKQGDSRIARLSSSEIEHQRNVEKDMASQIQTMLESVVGQGKAVVRVNAELDFKVTERTEETFDPESPVLRSSQKQQEKAVGAAPATARAAARTAEEGAGGPEKEKSEETLNYEINKTVSKTVMPVGEIKKISIAVIVDGIYQKDDKGAVAYQERAKKELDSFEDLVRKSAGFNAQRGDQVVVSSMPFNRPGTEEIMPATSSWKDYIAPAAPILKYAAVITGLLFTFLFIIRPLISNVITTALRIEASQQRQVASDTGVSVSVGGGAQQPQLTLADLNDRSMSEMDLAKQLAGVDSRKFADLLRNWLK